MPVNEIPHVNETVEQTDIGKKAEVNGQTDSWDTIPKTIKELLAVPPLLPHENEKAFLDLFESFRAYAEPEDIVDYHLVYTATVGVAPTVHIGVDEAVSILACGFGSRH